MPDFDAKVELKKIFIQMHLKTRELLEVHKSIVKDGPSEQLTQERDKLMTCIKVCQDIASDVLNYWRYLPESALALKHRLETATAARD